MNRDACERVIAPRRSRPLAVPAPVVSRGRDVTIARLVRAGVVLAMAGSTCCAVTGCGRHASAAECAALLDRYVELLVRQEDPKASEIEIAQQKERTRAKAEKDAAFASCPNEVTAKGAMCAMKAVNVDEFEKCLE